MNFRAAIYTATYARGPSQVDVLAHTYLTAACAFGIGTRTAGRHKTARTFTTTGTEGQTRQLALDCKNMPELNRHTTHTK